MKLVVARPQPPGDSPCATCKILYGASCCEDKDRSDDGPRVPMTFGEAKRIATWERKPVEDCVSVRPVSAVDVILLSQVGEGLESLIVGGMGLYLPEMEDRSCFYLGPKGCGIPNAKPHWCALFPFSLGLIGWRVDRLVTAPGFCYARDVSNGDVAGALMMFGETSWSLNRIYAEWKKDQRYHRTQMKRFLRR